MTSVFAEQIIERGDDYATISANIVFSKCAQAAFDNANFGQENASQHAANTVIYQYCRNGEFKVIVFQVYCIRINAQDFMTVKAFRLTYLAKGGGVVATPPPPFKS